MFAYVKVNKRIKRIDVPVIEKVGKKMIALTFIEVLVTGNF